MGRAFLISSETLAGVSSKSPHSMSERLGLVDFVLGLVIVSVDELFPRFVEQPPTSLLDIHARGELIPANRIGAGGGRRRGGRLRFRRAAAAGWPAGAAAAARAHDRFGLGQLLQVLVECLLLVRLELITITIGGLQVLGGQFDLSSALGTVK